MIVNINLLQWRDLLRYKRKKQFLISLLITAIFAVIVVVSLQLVFTNWYKHQLSRTDYLQAKIKKLDIKVKEIKNIKERKKLLLSRLAIIQKLQLERPQVVHLFSIFDKIIPKGVYLTHLSKSGNTLQVIGKSSSNAQISKLMRSINNSGWMRQTRLHEIKKNNTDNKRFSDFRMEVSVINKEKLKKNSYKSLTHNANKQNQDVLKAHGVSQ